ncbi:tetratricopeptide repeat protein [Pontibacter sp. CAU 1760]
MQQYKKNHSLLLVLTLSVGLTAPSCTLQRMVRTAEKGQSVTVSPNPLEANGQSVNFELKAQVPEKLVREEQTYKLDVYYEYGMKREEVATYSFKFGEYVYENDQPTVTRQLAFPYAPEKNPGRLMVQGRAMDNKEGNVRYTKPRQVAAGLVTTPLLLVQKNDFSYLLTDSFQVQMMQPGTVSFLFPKNKATLETGVGPDAQVLEQYVLDNVNTQEITIKASQAPDEPTPNLATKRAQALEKLYRQKLQTLDYSGKRVNIKIQPATEGLHLLEQKISSSAMVPQEKQQALSIMKSSQSREEKLKALEQLPAADYIKKFIYPNMRSAELVVNYNKDRKPDYELYVLAQKIANGQASASELSEAELQYAATLTPLLQDKRKFYEAAVKSTDKWPAYYNLGVVYNELARKEYRTKVKQDLLAQAIHNLSYAGFRNPTAPVYYSLASAYHLRGDREEALEYYNYAIKLGGEEAMLQQIFADKAALEMEMGLYDEAISTLRYAGDSYQTNMNLGLSYLLKENYEGAAQFYTQALEQKPNDALAYYSLALLGARTQNEQQLEQNLRRAIQADRSYTQKAITDPEFESYREKNSFKDALLH